MIRIQGKIKVKQAWTPQLSRDNDFMLMDSIHGMDYGLSDRKLINNWRLHFQVLSLSDITTAAGDRIADKYRNFRD